MPRPEVLTGAMAAVAEAWSLHRTFERSPHGMGGGTCECGLPLAEAEWPQHQADAIAMNVEHWSVVEFPCRAG
mgnify:CR=1 FL=1